MTASPFADRAPSAPALTDYDRAHVTDYLRLLDAEADGADWREVVEIVLCRPVADEPQDARAMYDSHLERARWLSQQGYRELVWGDRAKP